MAATAAWQAGHEDGVALVLFLATLGSQAASDHMLLMLLGLLFAGHQHDGGSLHIPLALFRQHVEQSLHIHLREDIDQVGQGLVVGHFRFDFAVFTKAVKLIVFVPFLVQIIFQSSIVILLVLWALAPKLLSFGLSLRRLRQE